MILDRKTWDDFFGGFQVTDCAIEDRERLYFALTSLPDDDEDGLDEALPRTRFVSCALEQPLERRFYFAEFDSLSYPSTAVVTAPAPGFLAVDVRGQVYSLLDGDERNEDRLLSPWPNNHLIQRDMRSSIQALKRVGDRVYALATERQLFLREGVGRWKPLANTPEGVPFPMKLEPGASSAQNMGFKDLSAFSPDDMYAVGGSGDVWHYGGKRWSQVKFPSDLRLDTVCCAGDGKVYITGQDGTVWAGREGTWKQVQQGAFGGFDRFVDSVWFADTLYCGSTGHGLWKLDGKGRLAPVRQVDTNPISNMEYGHPRLDVSLDGKHLLIASGGQAILHDGKQWELLFREELLEAAPKPKRGPAAKKKSAPKAKAAAKSKRK
ncbi:hypothetical protein HPC49_14605 [Pyxidicoccus fallax]|uniref:Uncharacterized protein n=1 Tax=Pyxidicoccus fallax TaxID=394095 RepID=A0A848LMW7_9BACT|nr:hypothetical protein [Pyxidicoccus fallax]NMO18963.1 hypothetical protein [Pyxidicoccus fallax]NPC79462.1 hypothetical protein [Pyxidicoccus fallax]